MVATEKGKLLPRRRRNFFLLCPKESGEREKRQKNNEIALDHTGQFRPSPGRFGSPNAEVAQCWSWSIHGNDLISRDPHRSLPLSLNSACYSGPSSVCLMLMPADLRVISKS
jgi:hypothetical protein